MMVPAAAQVNTSFSPSYTPYKLRLNFANVTDVLIDRGVMEADFMKAIVEIYIFNKETPDNEYDNTSVSQMRATYQQGSNEQQQLIQDLFIECIANSSGTPVPADVKKRIEDMEAKNFAANEALGSGPFNVPDPRDLLMLAEAFENRR